MSGVIWIKLITSSPASIAEVKLNAAEIEEKIAREVEFDEKEKMIPEIHAGLHIGGLATLHLSTASISVREAIL